MGEQVHTLYGLYLPLPVRGNRIRQAHQENGAVYLPQKYLIAHIITKFAHADDPVAFTAQMEEKINQLTREQADEIMNPHKEENQSREQATFDLLNQYLG